MVRASHGGLSQAGVGMAGMGGLQHQQDLGKRLLAESIQLQQRVAQVPLPPEPDKDRPVLLHLAIVFGLLFLIALCGLLVAQALVH
jgi:hypothetical protein